MITEKLVIIPHPIPNRTWRVKMNEKVAIIGIEREKGWLYFIDKEGDISRVEMQHKGRVKKSKLPRFLGGEQIKD